MKHILKFAFAAGLAVIAGSASAKAQTVVLNGLGSSGLFLELGLGANSPTGAINAPCVWSENTNSVQANDTKVTPTAVDKGSSWVAWTKGSDGTCGTAGNIYAYLSTDSVVGNRCLYNASTCTIAYPVTTPASNGLILGTSAEVSLPSTVAAKLNTAAVNYAGTDIRPEDAEFAIKRATTSCGSAVGTSTQYLGLGYVSGGTTTGTVPTGIIESAISSSFFNVVDFSLPSAYFVTPVGATPIVVAVNDAAGTGLRASTNITSQNLAFFLDGTSSYTGDVSTPGSTSGSPVTVYIREPLSGTYNTMEYNVPNRVGTLGGSFATSQDVGLNQPSGQKNCSATAPLHNPLNFATASTGARKRAIGTGEELKTVVANTSNSIGYGFWSAANFAPFSTVTSSARYYKVDGIDPLASAGVIPTTASELASVSLATTADGQYPIWSMLRLVNVGATQNTAVANLSAAAQTFSTSTHPDFVALDNMLVVRSHFIPPAGTGEPTTASDGSGSLAFGSNKAAACSATETGGDVGGVVIGLNSASFTQTPLTLADETYCQRTSTTGQTGHRR